MSTNSDPLLRAVADGDPACPDGRVLVALGRLIRSHSQPPRSIDLGDDVLGRLNDLSEADGDAIDALYDRGEPGTPDLQRLGALMREAHRLPAVDLVPAVLRRISVAQNANDGSVTIDARSRWRIWSAVVAGHLAALLAFAIFQVGFDAVAPTQPGAGAGSPIGGGAPGDHPADGASGTSGQAADHVSSITIGTRDARALPKPDPARAGGLALPSRLPLMWSDIRGQGADLFLLRRFLELRQQARRSYGMEASAASVTAGLAWLQAQQDPSNGFIGKTSADLELDLTTQSLAVLALLGEGLGDKARTTTARRGLEWMRTQLTVPEDAAPGTAPAIQLANANPASAGLVCLALVEGGLLLGDAATQRQAEQALADLDRDLPMQPGTAGLGGFTLLALETAQQGGLYVPGRLLQQARRTLGRSLPAQDDDAGRLGLAAFARLIYGHRDNSVTSHQLESLGGMLPARDPAGRADPLSWFFATLALRETDGAAWQHWSTALQNALLPLFTSDAAGQAHVDAHAVQHAEAGGDVFATSVVLLNLQAPYRYLPLAKP